MAGLSGAANPLWMAEWLAEAMELRPGMRVLDLGCGRGTSSIFLHREFGVEVWATDLWFPAEERFRRIQDAGAADGVFPIHADARSLPFPAGFFDAAVSLDSYIYYGTDDFYLNYLARFLKPGGQLGIAGSGFLHEIEPPVPVHLQSWWTPDMACLHSSSWWRRHWRRSGLVDIQTADVLPEGWRYWLEWHRRIAPGNLPEIDALEADQGRYLGYVRIAARRRAGVEPTAPIETMPTEYVATPMLRVP